MRDYLSLHCCCAPCRLVEPWAVSLGILKIGQKYNIQLLYIRYFRAQPTVTLHFGGATHRIEPCSCPARRFLYFLPPLAPRATIMRGAPWLHCVRRPCFCFTASGQSGCLADTILSLVVASAASLSSRRRSSEHSTASHRGRPRGNGAWDTVGRHCVTCVTWASLYGIPGTSFFCKKAFSRSRACVGFCLLRRPRHSKDTTTIKTHEQA